MSSINRFWMDGAICQGRLEEASLVIISSGRIWMLFSSIHSEPLAERH
jgi:hypothetical protein